MPTTLQLLNRQTVLAALISGTYKQGTETLRGTLGGQTYHCCLGVVCDSLKIESRVCLIENERYDTVTDFVANTFVSNSLISEEFVVEQFGMAPEHAQVFVIESIAMNDNDNQNFQYIHNTWVEFFAACDAYALDPSMPHPIM